jgi:hypothetical protein
MMEPVPLSRRGTQAFGGMEELWTKGERPFKTFKRQICIRESERDIVDSERVSPWANSTSAVLQLQRTLGNFPQSPLTFTASLTFPPLKLGTNPQERVSI